MLRRLAMVAAVALIAGCASRSGTGAGTGAGTDMITSAPMAITAVTGRDATHVQVTAQVPGPSERCAVALVGRVTDSDAHSVFVQVTVRSTVDPSTCTTTRTKSAVVTIPALRGRVLSFGYEGGPWAASPTSAAFRHCTGPFGCAAPPADHCDPKWLYLAGHSGELQPERSFRTLGCTQDWLVMDISATVTGCQPMDGRAAPSGCRSTQVRWFLRFDKGWTVVASGGRAGCASVHATVPQFPSALCRKLPAR